MESSQHGGWTLNRSFGRANTCLIGPLEAVTVQGRVDGFALSPSTSFNLPNSGSGSVTGPYALPFAKVIVLVNGTPTCFGATNVQEQPVVATTSGENSTATVRWDISALWLHPVQNPVEPVGFTRFLTSAKAVLARAPIRASPLTKSGAGTLIARASGTTQFRLSTRDREVIMTRCRSGAPRQG